MPDTTRPTETPLLRTIRESVIGDDLVMTGLGRAASPMPTTRPPGGR